MNLKRERLKKIDMRLEEVYPDAVCALEYGADPWKLLVMARLSAQCTDARVNIVSKTLFEEIPDVYAMAKADISEIEERINSTDDGSITSFQAIYIPADDYTDEAVQTITGHLDGQIVLDRSVAEKGIYPAVSWKRTLVPARRMPFCFLCSDR